MPKKKNNNNIITIVAFAISIIAISLSGYSVYTINNSALKANTLSLTDTQFDAKVENSIQNIIKKQEAANKKAQAEAAAKAAATVVKVSVDDDAVKGKKDAKITIVEFSDFECPYCAMFYKDTYSKLVKEYIDTGKAKLVYRDYPLSFHKNAKGAAMSAECAREQGGDKMYFKYHDKLYENQNSFSDANFKKWAKDLKLKTTQFNKCLDSKKYSKEVDKDFTDGQSYGVTGTPAFFINGRKLTGAQPFSAFEKIIKEELKK